MTPGPAMELFLSILFRLSALAVLTTCMCVMAKAAPTPRSVLNGYADFSEALYEDAAGAAGKVRAAVDGFLAEPDAAKLATAQAAFGVVLVPLRHAEGAGLGAGGGGGIAELLLGGTAADFSAAGCPDDGCADRRDRLKAAADGFAAQLNQKAKDWGKDGDRRKALGGESVSRGLDHIISGLVPNAAPLQKMPMSRAEAEALYQRQVGAALLYNGYYRRHEGGRVKVADLGAYVRDKTPAEARVLEQALTATTRAFEALRRLAPAPAITDETLIARARAAAVAQARAARQLGEALKVEAADTSAPKAWAQ